LKIEVSLFRAQHSVQADKGGLRRPFRDSAPKAGSPVGFFLPIPALAANASRWALHFHNKKMGFDMILKIAKQIVTAVLVVLISITLIGCGAVTPVPTATPTSTATIIPTKTPIPTNTPTPTVTPRPIITIEPYSNLFPKNWELEPLSDEQIKEVTDCDIEKIVNDRYPKNEKSDELIYLFEPITSCDWAVLAFAYSERVKDGESMPDIAKNAFAQAISTNPGFAFSTPLFYRFFFDAFIIVSTPSISEQEISRVKIGYKWGGIGDPVQYVVDIRQANTNPVVRVTNYESAITGQNFKNTVDKDLVQKLGKSLSNLLPIETQFSLMPCYDNIPDWIVTLTFIDGTTLTVKTNASNVLYVGGPWQTKIDEQNYLQFSVDFIAALDSVIQEIGLPYGQPAAMYCNPESVLDKAYP